MWLCVKLLWTLGFVIPHETQQHERRRRWRPLLRSTVAHFFLAPVRITAILRLSSVNLSYIWLSSDKTEESRTNTWRPSHVVCDYKLSRLRVNSGFNCMLHIGVWAGGLQTPESGKIIFFGQSSNFSGSGQKWNMKNNILKTINEKYEKYSIGYSFSAIFHNRCSQAFLSRPV